MWGRTLIRPPAEMVACRLISRSARRRSAVDVRGVVRAHLAISCTFAVMQMGCQPDRLRQVG